MSALTNFAYRHKIGYILSFRIQRFFLCVVLGEIWHFGMCFWFCLYMALRWRASAATCVSWWISAWLRSSPVWSPSVSVRWLHKTILQSIFTKYLSVAFCQTLPLSGCFSAILLGVFFVDFILSFLISLMPTCQCSILQKSSCMQALKIVTRSETLGRFVEV